MLRRLGPGSLALQQIQSGLHKMNLNPQQLSFEKFSKVVNVSLKVLAD